MEMKTRTETVMPHRPRLRCSRSILRRALTAAVCFTMGELIKCVIFKSHPIGDKPMEVK